MYTISPRMLYKSECTVQLCMHFIIVVFATIYTVLRFTYAPCNILTIDMVYPKHVLKTKTCLSFS